MVCKARIATQKRLSRALTVETSKITTDALAVMNPRILQLQKKHCCQKSKETNSDSSAFYLITRAAQDKSADIVRGPVIQARTWW